MMINALHLLWIIPVAAMYGFLVAAVLGANGDDDDYDGWEGK